MQKPLLSRRDAARAIWVVQATTLVFEGAWLAIVHFIHPPPGSFLESMPQYLRLLGGNSRFTFLIGVTAFVIDRLLSARQQRDGATSPVRVWLIRGILAFALLWGTGALVVIVLAFIFSRH
jgi:hypothetical protein